MKQAQEAQESTNNQHHQTHLEQTNDQVEDVLQTVDSNATEDQTTKKSLTEQQVAETTATSTIEKVKLHNLMMSELHNTPCDRNTRIISND